MSDEELDEYIQSIKEQIEDPFNSSPNKLKVTEITYTNYILLSILKELRGIKNV